MEEGRKIRLQITFSPNIPAPSIEGNEPPSTPTPAGSLPKSKSKSKSECGEAETRQHNTETREYTWDLGYLYHICGQIPTKTQSHSVAWNMDVGCEESRWEGEVVVAGME
ncbi:hypothetical protein ONZ45_g16484 [Pleurotus djamor]|nr:hypothetical protein ONZ45_g16484 [Pleurotus djamor]